jgi:hypothetical protein
MRLILFFSIFILTATPLMAQEEDAVYQLTRQERRAESYQRFKSLVETGSFQFVAVWGVPQVGSRIDLNGNNNYIRFQENEVDTFLQYFGRIYSGRLANSGNGGIVFQGGVEQWEVRYDEKKRRIDYRFNFRNSPESFEITLRITDGGGASVTVSSNQRDSMTFDGYIEPLEARG